MNRRVRTWLARTWVAVVIAAFSPAAVFAQAPAPGGDQKRMAMMQKMAAADQRLADLVARMNAATGEEKTAAIAAVVTELAAQRRQMQEHGCMRGEKAETTEKAPPRADADKDAGHTAHHPEK